MTRIKICGMTNKPDAIAAAELGVDMLGFVFYKSSKRYIEPGAAKEITNELPQSLAKAGVFVDAEQEEVVRIAEDVGLDILQFHGDETPEYCDYFKTRFKVIKAFRLKDRKDLKKINDYGADFYLLDTYRSDTAGGTGEAFDWKILKDFEFLRPVILSGGLTPKNVGAAIRELAPFGVDVSTGVEASPGRKDAELMKEFVHNVRKAG